VLITQVKRQPSNAQSPEKANKHTTPTILISFDGAQPSVIEQLIKAGKLTKDGGFAKLIGEGTQAQGMTSALTSTTSGFGTEIEAETLWEAAKRQGKKVVTIAFAGADGRGDARRGDQTLGFGVRDGFSAVKLMNASHFDSDAANAWTLGGQPCEFNKANLGTATASQVFFQTFSLGRVFVNVLVCDTIFDGQEPDVAPTIADLLGIEPRWTRKGKNSATVRASKASFSKARGGRAPCPRLSETGVSSIGRISDKYYDGLFLLDGKNLACSMADLDTRSPPMPGLSFAPAFST
jgi:hypothetical protein